MANLKTLIFLQAYEDTVPSNSPKLNNFKWTRESTNYSVSSALSDTFQIPPQTTQSLFSGMRTLAQDGTTQYSISLVPMMNSMYQLTNVGGTPPAFRTLRSIGTDATSQVTTSLNGTVLTFTFTGGTLPSLGSVVAGDQVLIGDDFNQSNQGIWQIIATTSTSISIVNPLGAVEGPITLGSGFATQLRIFSAAGVQIGDTLSIFGGFSPVSQNAYQITQVTDYYLQFSYTGVLPIEGPITTDDIAVYTAIKNMIYLESDQNLEILINGAESGPVIVPSVSNGIALSPGIFMLNGNIYSLSVINNSINEANITLLSTE